MPKNKNISGLISGLLNDSPEIVAENFNSFMESRLQILCEPISKNNNLFEWHDYDDYGDIQDHEFADPDGRSALRAGKRVHPCPTCGQKNKLTAKDKQLGYQCDSCADRAERGIGESTILLNLSEIIESKIPKIIHFENKTAKIVNFTESSNLLKLFESLGESEQDKFIEKIQESRSSFDSLLDFTEGSFYTATAHKCDYCDTQLDKDNKAEYGHGIYKQTGKTSKMASICKGCKDACHKAHIKMIPEGYLIEVDLIHSSQNARIHNLLKEYGYNMDQQKSKMNKGHKVFVHNVTGNSMVVGPLDSFDSLKSRLSSQEKIPS